MRVVLRTAPVCSLLFTCLCTITVAFPAAGQPLSVGPNVNIVGGPASISLGPPFRIQGDPYLQRQNEPSMACSSRNPVNCLAAANDYRLVGTPGVQDGRVTGDAWLGIFWSHDEAQSWQSTLLPGFPQDTSAAGTGSPIRGLGAAADPTVRAGTNGLFYVSGVAFDRALEASGSGGKEGVMFVSLYIDDNNTQRADTPIRYIRTIVVDNGSSGQFLDKPWIAADIPRANAGTCTIPASDGVPQQVVPAGNVYAAYSVFVGSGNNAHAKLLFTRSTDCGQTWATPLKINESFQEVSQSALLSVNPLNGAILVAWRQFGDANFADPGRILVAQSNDSGRTFSKVTTVAELGLANRPAPALPTSVAFDQPSLPEAGDAAPTMRLFRTNGFPTGCIDTDGVYRLAWAQRWPDAVSDSRVVSSVSRDGGTTWSPPAPVEDPTASDGTRARGHQIMPAMACTANRATLLWYDQRYDNAAMVFGPGLFGYWIVDPIPAPPAHTLDVRAAQSDPADLTRTLFLPSTQVSRYQWAVDTTPEADAPGGIVGAVQLESNPVNWPLFAGGTTPFLGDYIDLAPARIFNSPIGPASFWTYNTNPDDAVVLHAVWTDNRDILNRSETWAVWSPPGAAGCMDGIAATKRNQNVYTARLSRGLVVGVEGNSRLVAGGQLTQRAFAVYIQNATTAQRRFRLTTGQPPGGSASFKIDAGLSTLYAEIPPRSTIARTVFVPAGQLTPVVLETVEVTALDAPVAGGLTGKAVINSDGTAPPPIDGTVATVESYTPSLSEPKVAEYSNPFADPDVATQLTYLNPTFINPTFINPTFINPTFINPTFINPTFINPTFINPTFINPTFINPTFINPTFINQPYTTDVSWQVTNDGNVAAGYNVGALVAALPANTAFQLLISRLYPTPGASGCALGQQYNSGLQTVIPDPLLAPTSGGNPLSPDATNATFTLAAQDSAIVTLRVQHDGSFDPRSATMMTVAQAATGSSGMARSAPAIAVPNAVVTAEATGPSGALVTYTAAAIDAAGASLAVACEPASGSSFPLGSTTVNCSATDSTGLTGSASFSVTVGDTIAPAILAPAGVTAEATSAAGAVVTFAVTWTDAVSGSGAAACVPASASTFPVGSTTVTCTATDAAGNTAMSSFPVTVRDTTGPVVVEIVTPTTLLWSPNKVMTPVTVSGTVTDATAVTLTYSVVDEYGYIQPTGSVTLGPNGSYSFTLRLEAWRKGSDSDGRTYTITVTVRDSGGNVGSATAVVKVPHNS